MTDAKRRILVIDDEREMVDMLAIRLSSHGYDVQAAFDGETGLKLALETRPDLILLDVMLPRLGGDGVCRKLKDNPATAKIPVILLTAKQEAGEGRFREWGADDYMIKPEEPKELLNKIRKWLKRA